jgi:alkylation response protein AidB-like acyl-CoA dehydrogenase
MTTALKMPSEQIGATSATAMLAQLKLKVASDLAPQVPDIDQGQYPSKFMHTIGEVGGFGQLVSKQYGGFNNGIKAAIQVIEGISEECLCTGFMTWCQIACTWYMEKSSNAYLKQELLPLVASGKVLGGTGLSNPMKHFAGIEKIALVAERRPNGYLINGLLPWVSNVGAGHHFGISARIADSDEYLMAIVSDDLEGLNLKQTAHFIALEGSNTFSCSFRNVFVPDELILAAPCEDYVKQIRPGFILTQVGMGLGLTKSCIKIMERSNQRYGHVNCFLDDQVEDIAASLAIARKRTYQIADSLSNEGGVGISLLKDIIQARLESSQLSLRAANAAMLHMGARGYLRGGAVERKLREAFFVSIVTPAVKQLKKMLHDLDRTHPQAFQPKIETEFEAV